MATVEKNGKTRKKKYEELLASKKLQAKYDLKATNIVLQGLPPDVYAIINHQNVSKEIWDRVKLLMQGTSLFSQLINDMHIINMTVRQVQVSTKFLNSLSPKWSKFVMDVKLARDLHTTNYDQLYSYLQQHEAHANETHLLHERYQDPLALVANYNQPSSDLNNYHCQYTSTQYLQQTSSNLQQVHSSQPYTPMYAAPPLPQPQISHPTSYIPQNTYHSPPVSTQPLTKFPQLDSGLDVPIFNLGDDLIACLNKAMAFMSAVAASRFPLTNNQLRTSSNLRN
ncbi:hypothetical protein Tco_1069176 [Tanacetum coccineum]|uniref:Integrase, catalytic region, zinc finger, CCHC-type, peptidase aspartic, catalytic n=1 Tax=Tanacetum coccineum TaxID=301880 RepID=A0ABQ5HI11_9ASTR